MPGLAALRHYNDHRLSLAECNQIVEDHMG
jgi:hypothetical protein